MVAIRVAGRLETISKYNAAGSLRLWQSYDNRLHIVFLLHAVFDCNDPILHSELLLSLHGKICPQVNVFSFDRLTGHETNLREFFLYGQNQFCSG